MRYTPLFAAALLLMSLAGCSTTQEVLLARAVPDKSIESVAQVPADGNSSEMDDHLTRALQLEGVSVKAPLPAGARKAADVDAIISYTDVWRWDLVMYLKSISIRMFDARSGDLLVSGEWNDSALHGFRDPRQVVEQLVREMFAKLRANTAQGDPAPASAQVAARTGGAGR
jgi:hypothetical protein